VSAQVNMSCNTWGNNTEYRTTPTEEDLTRASQLVSVPKARTTGHGYNAILLQGPR
jgi:hypothetical protein